MFEERKKELRRDFGLYDDADEKDMLWAIMDRLTYLSKPTGILSYPTKVSDDVELNLKSFIGHITALCASHNAVLYGRTNGKQLILSLEISGLWLDFKRISSAGAEPLEPINPQPPAKTKT